MSPAVLELLTLAGALGPERYAVWRAEIADRPDTMPEWVRKHPAYIETRRKIREARA
jgi:hypothetical protein